MKETIEKTTVLSAYAEECLTNIAKTDIELSARLRAITQRIYECDTAAQINIANYISNGLKESAHLIQLKAILLNKPECITELDYEKVPADYSVSLLYLLWRADMIDIFGVVIKSLEEQYDSMIALGPYITDEEVIKAFDYDWIPEYLEEVNKLDRKDNIDLSNQFVKNLHGNQKDNKMVNNTPGSNFLSAKQLTNHRLCLLMLNRPETAKEEAMEAMKNVKRHQELTDKIIKEDEKTDSI